MPKEIRNLFTGLHKWARRQDENFITTAFVYILKHLLENDKVVGWSILRLIVGDKSDCPCPNECPEKVTVRMHEKYQLEKPGPEPCHLNRGRQIIYPDIQIDYECDTKKCVIHLEAKVRAGFHGKQKTSYSNLNKGTKDNPRALIVLAYHPLIGNEVRVVRWYEIAYRLKIELERGRLTNQISKFLATELLDFWKNGKKMCLARIENTLEQDIANVRASEKLPPEDSAAWNLFAQLRNAAASCQLHTKRTGVGILRGPSSVRIRLWKNKKKKKKDCLGWIGLKYDAPSQLVYRIRESGLSEDEAKRLNFSLVKGSWQKTEQLEPAFFKEDTPVQLRHLEEFLKCQPVKSVTPVVPT